jgi:hypothetical protein
MMQSLLVEFDFAVSIIIAKLRTHKYCRKRLEVWEMMQKALKKPANLGDLLYLLIPVVIGFIWMILIPNDQNMPRRDTKTSANLTASKAQIAAFIQEYQDVPHTLTELRAFSWANGSPISAFDAYGETLDYIRLTHKHFALRSFGRDGRQNTLFSEPDPSIQNWDELPSRTPIYRYQKTLIPSLYPSPLILGSISANGEWHAQVYHDQQSGSRRLLVRNRKKDVFLLAKHDLIEEFLWLPDSNHIVFTASSSVRYNDGIYLWDVLNDTEVNVLDQGARQIGITDDTSGYYFALAGVALDGRNISIFITPRYDVELNPLDFFSPANLHTIKLDGESRFVKIERANAPAEMMPLARPIDLTYDLLGDRKDSAAFQAWANLSFNGPLEETIANWQDFSSNHAESTLIPYCLWFLSAIYDEAFKVMKTTDPNAAQVLRGYGSELSKALAELPYGPSYLRAFGQFNYRVLTQGEHLPYKIASLKVETARANAATKGKSTNGKTRK